MRRVIKYVAFDDTVFDTLTQCEEYEAGFNRARDELVHNVRFFGKNMAIMNMPSAEDGDFDEIIEDLVNNSTFITILNDLSEGAQGYLNNFTGIIIPVRKGRYRYDFNKCEWIRFEDDLDNLLLLWNMSIEDVIRKYE